MEKNHRRVYKYYKVISKFYKGKSTSKGIPYTNHIDEGIGHLENLHVDDTTINAFILHPFVQCVNLVGTYGKTLLTEKELEKHINIFEIEPDIAHELLLYRKYANSYLCRPETDDYAYHEAVAAVEGLEQYPNVVKMLIADKLQNFKDFLKYRQDHPRKVPLTYYFRFWLIMLSRMSKASSIKDYINHELKLMDQPPVTPNSNL